MFNKRLYKKSFDLKSLGFSPLDMAANFLSFKAGSELASKKITKDNKKYNRVSGLRFIKKELELAGYRDISSNPKKLKEYIRLLAVPEQNLYGNIAKALLATSLMAGWASAQGKLLKGKAVSPTLTRAIDYVGSLATGAITESVMDKVIRKIEKGFLTRAKIKKAAKLYRAYSNLKGKK